MTLSLLYPPPTPKERTADISYSVPGRSGSTGLPSRGASGEGGGSDGATSALPASERAGHRDHSGVGQLPPPTVYPL